MIILSQMNILLSLFVCWLMKSPGHSPRWMDDEVSWLMVSSGIYMGLNHQTYGYIPSGKLTVCY